MQKERGLVIDERKAVTVTYLKHVSINSTPLPRDARHDEVPLADDFGKATENFSAVGLHTFLGDNFTREAAVEDDDRTAKASTLSPMSSSRWPSISSCQGFDGPPTYFRAQPLGVHLGMRRTDLWAHLNKFVFAALVHPSPSDSIAIRSTILDCRSECSSSSSYGGLHEYS